MAESVILVGGSGHAKVIIDCIRAAGDQVAGILDDGIPIGTQILGVPVLGTTADWTHWSDHAFLIAIGSNGIRRRLAQQVHAPWYTAIHPKAIVSEYARIGAGSVVMAGAIVNADAAVGMHCIVNTGAIVEHDNILADFVHISPNAALGGTVHVGENTHIGIGASVKNNISICADCTVGAGAVVVKDIAEAGTYVGLPARRLK